MTDRAGFFAGLADSLTEMCAYYVVAGILIMSGRGWGLHLFWILLCAAGCMVLYSLLLKKPRSLPFLSAVTGALFLVVMSVFWLASKTPMKLGYGFVLAVGAGMAVGIPLHYTLHRPLIHQHLTRLDTLIIALAALLLTRDALGIDGGTVALMVLVLLLDAAGAVGLRMSDGETEDGRNAFRASMIALAAAAGLALLIGLLVLLFSRSGAVTGTILSGVGSFLASIGGGIERLFRWLASLVKVRNASAPLKLEEMPSLAGMGSETLQEAADMNLGPALAALAILLLAALVALVLIFRKKRIVRESDSAVSLSGHAVRRTGGTARAIWQRILERLRFGWTAFVNRNTPAGLLVTLERRGRRSQTPRQAGETMRHFIRRMDGRGGLDPLADALDLEYYAGRKSTMSPQQCRALRRYIRKAV